MRCLYNPTHPTTPEKRTKRLAIPFLRPHHPQRTILSTHFGIIINNPAKWEDDKFFE